MATTNTRRTLNDYRIFSEPVQETSSINPKLLIAFGVIVVALAAGGAEYVLQHKAVRAPQAATGTSAESVTPASVPLKTNSTMEESGTHMSATNESVSTP